MNLLKISQNKHSMMTGHFTQIVWKATEKVGCALVFCDTLTQTIVKKKKKLTKEMGKNAGYLACQYSPAGNVISRVPGEEAMYYKENVLMGPLRTNSTDDEHQGSRPRNGTTTITGSAASSGFSMRWILTAPLYMLTTALMC